MVMFHNYVNLPEDISIDISVSSTISHYKNLLTTIRHYFHWVYHGIPHCMKPTGAYDVLGHIEKASTETQDAGPLGTYYCNLLYMYVCIYIYISGWWFGTCFIFPYIGNSHPN